MPCHPFSGENYSDAPAFRTPACSGTLPHPRRAAPKAGISRNRGPAEWNRLTERGRAMKKIAAVITTYFPYSHADVIITKFMKGIPTDEELRQPRVELASIYQDQIDARDIGQSLAWRHRVPIFQSIRSALTLGGTELAVEGVLLIGEHGDYPC